MHNQPPIEANPNTPRLKLSQNITCSTYNSFEDIIGLQKEWDTFVESVDGDIFLTFDWCRVWWQHYGIDRYLKIFVFFQKNKIVGIVPMFFETIKFLFISIKVGKIVGSDFTLSQTIIPIHNQCIEKCMMLLVDTIQSVDWQVIILGPLSGLSTNTELLKNALCSSSKKLFEIGIEDGMVQTFFQLQPTWEQYLASLKKSQRRLIVRKYSALEKLKSESAAKIETVLASKENLTSFFNSFVDMHQAHWHSSGKLGHFGDWPDAYSFHYEMAQSQLIHGRLRLMSVLIDNEVLGFEYAYKFGGKYYAILNSRIKNEIYDKIGIGPILFSEQSKMAIDEKVSVIDAMRGKYDYKLMLGGQLATIKKIFIFRNDYISTMRIKFFRYLFSLINFIYYRLWFTRIAPKMTFMRNSLWRFWIRISLLTDES